MGPPLVMTKLTVNSWNAIIICMTRLKYYRREKRQSNPEEHSGFDIPSTVAASYNSFRICFNPARNITIDNKLPDCQKAYSKEGYFWAAQPTDFANTEG